MFSLILGFIIFLSIVCKIPYSHQFYEDLKYKGYHSFTWGRMVLPINRFDEALKIFDQKYNEIEAKYDSWGMKYWVCMPLNETYNIQGSWRSE